MTDFELQQQLAQQRLQQYGAQSQYQSPQGRMAGRVYVAPNALEYLAAGLRSTGAQRGQQVAEQDLQDIGAQRQKAVTEALRNFGQASQGQAPAQLAPAEQQAYSQMGDMSPTVGGVKPDMNAAYGYLMAAPDASLRQSGMQGIMQMPQLEAQKAAAMEERQFRRDEANLNRQQRMQEINTRIQDARTSREERAQLQRDLAQMQIDARRDIAGMMQAGKQQPQAQIVQTENGPMQLVNKQAVPILGPDNKPIRGVKPATVGEEQKRVTEATDVLSMLNDAEKLIPKSTGSYAGAAADEAARAFGISTPGAQSAAELKALQGALVSKMPKMSGPQSDKDVLLYREMAGQIGDPTIPAATKLAAINTIRRLNERYAGVPEGSSANGAKPAAQSQPRARIRFDAQGNVIP